MSLKYTQQFARKKGLRNPILLAGNPISIEPSMYEINVPTVHYFRFGLVRTGSEQPPSLIFGGNIMSQQFRFKNGGKKSLIVEILSTILSRPPSGESKPPAPPKKSNK